MRLTVLISAILMAAPAPALAKPTTAGKPTIVLVHGAFADASSWDPVVKKLIDQGYPVVAVANPLRGVKSDATYVATILDSIPGPVVLVGHSYGGTVNSNAATGKSNVKALVFVAAFAPEAGESVNDLNKKFPGAVLGAVLAPPVPLPGGGKDLSIQQDKFHDAFAADVPESAARIKAAAQRPVTDASLAEPSGPPAWKAIPSWFIYGSMDKAIPKSMHAFMAQRAGSKKTVEVKGASHVVMLSHPDETVKMIVEASKSVSE